MESVKDYVECINFHWIVVVVTGMYTHLRQICIIGLCFDEDNIPPFDPSYASVLFIFSVLCLLAEYKLWPRSLKEPPIQLMVIYEMLVAALVTNLATRTVWIPLLHAIWCMTQESSRWLTWLNSTIGFDNYSFLYTIATYMGKDLAAIHTSFCLSVLSFFWMLDATESLDGILDMWTKDCTENTQNVKRKHKGRITFEDPEMTNYFFYKCRRLAFEKLGSMARVLSTVWAFLLHITGVSIFQTCFANAMEDWDGDSLLTGPPITSFLFAFGIYIIILNVCLFPVTFRKPQIALLSIYEFLATAFFLEFSMACIWTPIDIVLMITLPRKLCQILIDCGLMQLAEWISANKIPMGIVCYLTAFTFFYFCLHVTRSLDFSILNKCGLKYFGSHIKNVFWTRILSELPSLSPEDRRRPCRTSRRRRSRDSNTNYDDY